MWQMVNHLNIGQELMYGALTPWIIDPAMQNNIYSRVSKLSREVLRQWSETK